MMARILLVEDEKILRDAFAIILKAQEFTLDLASDGQEAVELCRANTYDLILLDLMMPVLDGVGFLEKSGITEKSPQTKIVILSNLSSGAQISEALEFNVHRQVVKATLTPKDLVALVKEVLALS